MRSTGVILVLLKLIGKILIYPYRQEYPYPAPSRQNTASFF